jgi:hypothetical protein
MNIVFSSNKREKQNEFWDKQIQDTLNRATEKLPDH